MIRIFYVIDSFEFGGAQRQLLELIRGLDPKRYEVAVCPLWPVRGFQSEFLETGARIIDTQKMAHLDVTIAWRLARRMRCFRPHIVHSWLFTGNFWGRLAAALARVPVVIASERNVVPDNFLPTYEAWLNYALANKTDVMIHNSQAGFDRDAVSNLKRLIYNGVDLQRFDARRSVSWSEEQRNSLGLDPDLLVVGTIGRLATQKGQKNFLHALRLLREDGLKLQGVVVGEGPLQADLEALADELGLRQEVSFLGARKDIPEILSLFDIFVLPSLWEGFPNVILEAMAMAKPVVATKVAGVVEVVVDGVTGCLVDPGDLPRLAEAIGRLSRDPGLIARMGQDGRKRVEAKFCLERMVAETTALYQELIGLKGIKC